MHNHMDGKCGNEMVSGQMPMHRIVSVPYSTTWPIEFKFKPNDYQFSFVACINIQGKLKIKAQNSVSSAHILMN